MKNTFTMKKPQPPTIRAEVLPDLFELYLEERIREGEIAESTVQSYRVQIAPFMAWFAQRPDKTLDPYILGEYTRWLRHDFRTTKGEKPAPNTYKHSLDRLRSLLLWCFKRNCIPVNMSDWLPRPRSFSKQAYFPEIDELQRLFDSITGIARIRNWALLALLISTGARIYEVSQATTGDLHFQTPMEDLRLSSDHSGTLHLRKTKFDSEGRGEGRIVVFCSKAGLLLKTWLRCNDNRPDQPIFGLLHDGMMSAIRSTAESAGLEDFSPHAMRRAFADYWDATHGIDGRTILKRQLGHSTKGDVTEAHYIRTNHRRIAASIARWHVSPLQEIHIDWKTLPVQWNE